MHLFQQYFPSLKFMVAREKVVLFNSCTVLTSYTYKEDAQVILDHILQKNYLIESFGSFPKATGQKFDSV